MNNKVVYTCLTANYDSLHQPLVIDESFDYICFSNDIDCERIGVWKICKIPFENNDPIRLSRMVKLLPHRVLGNYDYSIWIDANLQIKQDTFYGLLNSLIDHKAALAQINHPYRQCIYDEMYICLKEGRVSIFDTLKQMFHLRLNKYPRNNGLYENNIILRKHNDNVIVKIDEEWYTEFDRYSKRDQFSLCYVLWRNKFKPDLLFPAGLNSRNVSYIEYHNHNNHKSNRKLWEYRIRRHFGSQVFKLFNFICEKFYDE